MGQHRIAAERETERPGARAAPDTLKRRRGRSRFHHRPGLRSARPACHGGGPAGKADRQADRKADRKAHRRIRRVGGRDGRGRGVAPPGRVPTLSMTGPGPSDGRGVDRDVGSLPCRCAIAREKASPCPSPPPSAPRRARDCARGVHEARPHPWDPAAPPRVRRHPVIPGPRSGSRTRRGTPEAGNPSPQVAPGPAPSAAPGPGLAPGAPGRRGPRRRPRPSPSSRGRAAEPGIQNRRSRRIRHRRRLWVPGSPTAPRDDGVGVVDVGPRPEPWT